MTNPALVDPSCEHYAALSTTATRQPELFVFLPGTNQEPLQFQMIVNQAAANGFYAIGLAYPNTVMLESAQACHTSAAEPFVTDPLCMEQAREEILSGINSSTVITVTPANSIVGRLRSLLAYLDATYPNAGWGQFQDGSGAMRWNKVRISGHSQGAGHAGLIAVRQNVARMCTFGGPADATASTTVPANEPYITFTLGITTYYQTPASWITSAPATAPERLYSFRHENDAGTQQALMDWDVLGHLDIAGVVNVDGAAPPYSSSHALLTDRMPTRPGATPHSMPIVDDATPLTARGFSAYTHVWQYMCFDNPPVPPQPEPEPGCNNQCPDYGDAPDSSNPAGNPMSMNPNGGLPPLAFYPTIFTGAAGTGPKHLNAGANPNLNGAPANAIDSALGLESSLSGTLFSRVSNEIDPMLLPDQDNRRNIAPAPFLPVARSNRDGFDNAFTLPSGGPTLLRFAPCQSAAMQYAQFVRTPWAGNAFYTGTRFVNVWIDFNRDGDWADNNLGGPCPGVGVSVDEWFMRNIPAPAASGVFLLPPHPMPSGLGDRPMWLRISIADSQAPANSIGNGPANGYRFGETEDHLICLENADLGIWRPCVGGAIDTDGAQGAQFVAKPRRPITFEVDIDPAFVYPLTITWEAIGDGVRIEPGLQLESAQSVKSSEANRVLAQRGLPKPVPTPGTPVDRIVLGWYGCITCTLASAMEYLSIGQIEGPAMVSVTIEDARGARFSDRMNVQVGWRTFLPTLSK
jgi:hypothetical protein